MKTTKRQIIKMLVAGAMSWGCACGQVEAQTLSSRLMQHEQQIDDIIKGMTLEEKIAMLHGKNMFSSAGIPRLGIADMEYADGPFGIREEMEPHSWNSAASDDRLGNLLPHRFGTGCHLEHRLGLRLWPCHEP